ncbi:MAG: hypothetical protein IPJ18_19895 [Betaproteobacteria bacterium]|nr:hypothetical protein [Betaproteobacteria bacterium]
MEPVSRRPSKWCVGWINHGKLESTARPPVQHCTCCGASVHPENLNFWRAIDSTIDSLDTDSGIFRMLVDDASKRHAFFEKNGLQDRIDPDGVVCTTLGSILDLLSSMHADSAKKHDAACRDLQLTPDDGVADAYQEHGCPNEFSRSPLGKFTRLDRYARRLLEAPGSVVYQSASDLFEALVSIPA